MDSKEKAKQVNALRAKRYNLMKNYGLTLEEWQEMSKNGCWMCKRKDIRLNVDHRHVLGYKKLSKEEKRKEVRGCLCFRHNVLLKGVESWKNARVQLEFMIAYFNVFRMKGDE